MRQNLGDGQMNYEEAVQFHEKAKEYGSILGLTNIRNLMHELGDIWKELKIVHIAGTNGKGSVSCFLASVLKEAGYRVGQYNSPAVFDPLEVYQINREKISQEAYAACMQEVAKACMSLEQQGKPHPTVFEVDTAAAFLWFYKQKCDIVLLETGMGGSTDATNLIEEPLCSVFVSISMDHMAFLGDTLEKIAEVKSGIIKYKCPVVTADQKIKVMQVLQKRAGKMQTEIRQVQDRTHIRMEDGRLCYEYPASGTVRLSMTGSYQVENSAVAIETIRVLREQGYHITEEQLLNGLFMAHWQGRFECLQKDPLFYVDGAHNEDAAIKLKETLTTNFPDQKLIGIMGVMADKAYPAMLRHLLPLFEKIYTVTPENDRALSAEQLAREIRIQGKDAIAEQSVGQAVKDACKDALEESGQAVVIAFGSLYYLREVRCALYESMDR